MYKLLKIISIILLVLVIGGVGGVIFDNFIIPKLSTNSIISNYSLFKNIKERTTIVNNTQEIIIKDNESLKKVSAQVRQSIAMVTITTPDKYKSNKSGAVITDDGIIAIHSAEEFKNSSYAVLFSDGVQRKATFLANDMMTEITLLQIDNSDRVPALAFVHDDDLFVGQRIISISIDNYAQDLLSITPAYIQRISKATSINMDDGQGSSEKWQSILDIATQTKNSDMILVTNRGELAGIMYTDTNKQKRGIPVSAMRDTLNKFIKQYDFNNSPKLGLIYNILTPHDALQNNIKMKGIIVQGIDMRMAASKSDLRVGDQIISIDDEEISQELPLSMYLRNYKQGTEITLLIVREGIQKKISLDL